MNPYLELTKPRITVMVMATAGLGWALAGGGEPLRLILMLLGTGMASASAGAFNQLIEIEQDALMKRTKKRPLPSGRLGTAEAFLFALALATGGLFLNLQVGWGPFFITALTLAFYLLAYTPLKRLTPQSTWLGAVAGATPPMIGWVAATGRLDAMAWVLFAIQLLWQIPHFLALFWMYRDQYANAGFRVMPVVDPGGKTTAAQIALHAFAVLPASLAPFLIGHAGLPYAVGALLLSGAYLAVGMRASWTLAPADTRRLFLASLAYLPILFSMLLLGGIS